MSQWKSEGALNFYKLFKDGYLNPTRDEITGIIEPYYQGKLDRYGAYV